MSGPRFRFAPSPTGFFHVGGARTALFNWALARRLGGRFVLRIEDTDEARNRPEWTEGIISALEWLGISSADPTFEGPYMQSDNAEAHLEAARSLAASGRAYWCAMTPEEIAERAAADGVTGYAGWSRDLGLEEGPGRVLRFRVPEGETTVIDSVRGEVVFDNSVIEDFVLVRGNGTPVFNLANVVDDRLMGITHVVRAEEHLSNTPKQQMLWEALGHTPPAWGHVPVLVNEQRKKLSKRRDKVALEQYREEGYLADAMVNYLMTLGWSAGDDVEIRPWSEIESLFRLEGVNLSPAFFDVRKLGAFNGEYIRMMTADEFAAECARWVPESWDRGRLSLIAPHVQPRLVTFSDLEGTVDFLFGPVSMDEASWEKAMTTEFAPALLAATRVSYADLPDWSADALKEALESVMEPFELKLGKAQAPVRVAVTGRTVGPPLFESLEALGREESLARIDAAISRLLG
ncbi:MAG: glutamate--tRNA ligase [Actinobacteria bacterium]|nr:glutamate--tRNA ligase [Actinomycetota bacterium]MDA3010315.1 glutamate--tRNA ligase [Actinomycetota bacterium]